MHYDQILKQDFLAHNDENTNFIKPWKYKQKENKQTNFIKTDRLVAAGGGMEAKAATLFGNLDQVHDDIYSNEVCVCLSVSPNGNYIGHQNA